MALQLVNQQTTLSVNTNTYAGIANSESKRRRESYNQKHIVNSLVLGAMTSRPGIVWGFS